MRPGMWGAGGLRSQLGQKVKLKSKNFYLLSVQLLVETGPHTYITNDKKWLSADCQEAVPTAD